MNPKCRPHPACIKGAELKIELCLTFSSPFRTSRQAPTKNCYKSSLFKYVTVNKLRIGFVFDIFHKLKINIQTQKKIIT